MREFKSSVPLIRDIFLSFFLVTTFDYRLESLIPVILLIPYLIKKRSFAIQISYRIGLLVVLVLCILINRNITLNLLILLTVFFNQLLDTLIEYSRETKNHRGVKNSSVHIHGTQVWLTTIIISLGSLSFYSFLGYRFFFGNNTFKGILIIFTIAVIYNIIQGINHFKQYKGEVVS